MASASLAFRIFATDNASATFRAVASSADRLHGSLDAVGRVGSAIGRTVRAGALVAGAGLSAAAGVGLRTAANIEQAQIAFTTMLGSAQKARSFLGELQKFAAATPFEFPELVTASQRLLAFGFQAKDVIPTLTAIGDAVAGLGGGAEQIDQVTTAIGQMMAKGKVQSDEILQLTEVGVPALKILADGFHVSTGQMQEMITNGQVLSDKAIPILVQGLERGTKSTQAFGGMMEQQSHSLAGMFSTLKDNVTTTLSNLVTPAIPAIKKGIGLATQVVSEFGPRVQSALERAIQAARERAPQIGQAISNALHSDTAQRIADTIGSLASTVGDAVSDMASNVYDHALAVGTGLFGGIRDGAQTGDWSSLGETIGSVISDSIHRGVDIAVAMARTIGEGIRKIPWFTLAMELGKQVPTLLAGLATGLLNFDIGSLLSGLAQHWQDVLLGILGIAFTPARWLGKISELLARIPLVGSLLRWAFDALTGFSKGVVSKVGEAVSFLGRAFLDGFRKVFPGVGSAFASWLKLLPTRIGVAALEVAAKARAMVTGLGNAIRSGAGWVASKIGEIVATILRPFANAGGWLVGKGKAVISGLGSGLKAAFSGVTRWAAGIGGAIVRAVGDLGRVLYQAGRDVIQGLVNGVQSAMHKVTDVMGTVGSKVKGAFNSVLHIFSPSRVMAESGRFVVEGLVQGIESSAPRAIGAMTAIGADMARVPLTATAGLSAGVPAGQSGSGRIVDGLADALYEAVCRALADAQVRISPTGVATLVRTGALRVARR